MALNPKATSTIKCSASESNRNGVDFKPKLGVTALGAKHKHIDSEMITLKEKEEDDYPDNRILNKTLNIKPKMDHGRMVDVTNNSILDRNPKQKYSPKKIDDLILKRANLGYNSAIVPLRKIDQNDMSRLTEEGYHFSRWRTKNWIMKLINCLLRKAFVKIKW